MVEHMHYIDKTISLWAINSYSAIFDGITTIHATAITTHKYIS